MSTQTCICSSMFKLYSFDVMYYVLMWFFEIRRVYSQQCLHLHVLFWRNPAENKDYVTLYTESIKGVNVMPVPEIFSFAPSQMSP